MTVSVTFCGAAGGVTGSCYWLQTDHGSFLVDCGMFQGSKTVRELNYGPFPFKAEEISAVLLTHAHIDHSGLLPKLVKAGFANSIMATEPTCDLLTYMLPDSGYIQESEVERLNRRNARRGRPEVTPIYTRKDAEQTLLQLTPVEYHKWQDVIEGVRARFWDAGHLLGSASIEVEVASGSKDEKPTRLLFSGDIGTGEAVFNEAPEGPSDLDYLFVETTYGDRNRPEVTDDERRAMLGKEVREALLAGGNLVIPSFAVARTQELMVDLAHLFNRGQLPEANVFVDSPLARHATDVFARHLKPEDARALEHPKFHMVPDVDASKQLARITSGAIIISASGMCDAGRIRYHLKNNLWRSNCTVLLVGFQAAGSFGRVLQQGAKHVRIHGEEIEVHARIRTLDVYSGHADQDMLLRWTRDRLPVAKRVFLTHGEEGARTAFQQVLKATDIPEEKISLPMLDDTVILKKGTLHIAQNKPRLSGEELSRDDWHNMYAGTITALSDKLRSMSTPAERQKLLEKVLRDIGSV
ncbi:MULTISPECIES: MBL fold metallo-hydrolase [Thalassospira]|uniref:Beta-lactamase n=2 Tax=Thalassospira TaxID=168934 RepID=A0A367W5J6_9PROT|nr:MULTISPECIES: MBL fold metallo-hydrolase [Thalassospira]MDG4721051.1 MBL fold metallo-hydrolase [Thalassospira sp. FZY0004]RCK36706.1 beta-lactamase [Thalassospira profundimaris]